MKPQPSLVRLGAVFVLSSAALAAKAHVVLQQSEAMAGSYYRASFQIGHGCSGAATTALSIEIPPGVGAVRPMPKPGWTLSIESGELPQPVRVHGKLHKEGVRRVTWSGGPLPDAWYEEFVLMSKLPEQTGKLYFKARQHCDKAVVDWAQVPSAESSAALPFPAPVVDIQPAHHGAHAH